MKKRSKIICIVSALACALSLASCTEKKSDNATTAEITTAEETFGETMDTGILPEDFGYSVTDSLYSDSSATGSDIQIKYPVFESENAVMSDINEGVYAAATNFESFAGDLSDVTLDRSYTVHRYGDILSVVFDGQFAIKGIDGVSHQTYSVMYNMATGKQTTLYEILGVSPERVKSCVEAVYEQQHGNAFSSETDSMTIDAKIKAMDTRLYMSATSYIENDIAYVILPVMPGCGYYSTTQVPVSDLLAK